MAFANMIDIFIFFSLFILQSIENLLEEFINIFLVNHPNFTSANFDERSYSLARSLLALATLSHNLSPNDRSTLKTALLQDKKRISLKNAENALLDRKYEKQVI